ncbi:MAG TPA: peptide ABC transporter substrate-binding protein [Caproicibacter sp.]|nr:peptide ABC transporter substrate-binding protein [Caproicibacter sp.]
MKKRRLVSLILAAAMLATAFTGCGNASNPQSALSLTVQVGPEPDSIDPALNTTIEGAIYIEHIFEGLTKLDKNGKIVNGQAKDIKVSDDQLTYTVTLRDDIKWSDGKPVTAGDFVYSWQRVVDPKTASQYNYMFDPIVNATDIYNKKNTDVTSLGVKATDDKTLVIKLNAPCAYFKELLSRPMYYPVRKDIVEKNSKWTQSSSTYIGNGAYKMQSWDHKESLTYVKNPNYYNKNEVTVDTLKFALMEDDTSIQSAYQNGEIQFADQFPVEEEDYWKAKPDYKKISQLGTYFICFNTTKAPFNNPKVRKALSLVIDRNYIVNKVTKGGQIPAYAYVSTGISDADSSKQYRDVGKSYWSTKSQDYDKNVADAKQLLAEAGYPDGKEFPAFEYMYNTNSGHKAIAEALQNMWKEKLGLKCTLSSQEWAVFVDTRRKANYSVCRHGWLADYNDPISYLDMWVTGGGNNDAKWSNTTFDSLIKDAKSTGDQNKRMEDMHKAEDILMDEMPVAPIYFYTDEFLINTNLKGQVTTPLGDKLFMFVTKS